MSRAPLTIITDTTIVLPGAKTTQGTVVLEQGKIADITTQAPGHLLLSQDNVEVVNGQGCYLTPGLVDLQFNGAYGCDLNKASIRDIHQMLAQLPAHGVTSVLLTVISASHVDMITAINRLEEVIHHKGYTHTRPLGLHVEGPFLHPQFRGAHPSQNIQQPSLEEGKLLISPNVKLVTLAPEEDPEGELIRYLTHKGIRVSASHSNADVQAMLSAIESGLSSVTHVFNAMRAFHHRDPGIVGMALTDDRLYAQFIGDGVNIHPVALEIGLRCKPRDRAIIVSDSIALAGQPDGAETVFAGQKVTRYQGCALNSEGRIAGSAYFLSDCVKNIVNWQIAPFEYAIEFASTNPASYIAPELKLGKIETGYWADLALWDQQSLEVKATWIGGKLVYQNLPAQQVV